MTSSRQPCRLILEDGTVLDGHTFGANRTVTGEVVFNTGMVGYPESLTDPSYRGQILVLTYPLVGNYGVPGDDREGDLSRHFESGRVQVEGLVVAEYSSAYSHWSAQRSLSQWLVEHRVPGVSGIDTRSLTKRLREQGTMLGKIVHGRDEIDFLDPNTRNLVAEVTVDAVTTYPRGERSITLVDCGVKHSIIKAFLDRDITVIRCPWDHDLLTDPTDGVVISNGPGDPKMCEATIRNVRRYLAGNKPVLGICLGSQILGLAAGADTYKLKYGHRGQNQPCIEAGSGRCYITPQNHGYAVDSKTLPQDWRVWFYNNNDKTNEGIVHISKPFFGAQFHPEASPGPDDTEFLFDMFVRALA
jgi:carbamoyl-phosphate synthase small subunit